jgi:hypothetical protein
MKKIFSCILAAIVSVAAMAQKTIVNDAHAEKRDVPGFSAIRVSGAVDLYLSQGDEEAVAVSATETKYRDRIRTEVKDGTLRIWYDNEGGWRWHTGNKKLRAYVSFKDISKLEASGASNVFVNGTIKLSVLEVHLSGASDFKGAVEIKDFKVSLSGASDMMVKGTAGSLNIEVSGASDLKGYDLVVQQCDAVASGASDIKITVDKELNANASGASDIRFKGNGVIRKMNNNGASSVKKI